MAVGARAAVPDGAEVLDLGDATLMPGLVDAHTHLTGELSDDWNRENLKKAGAPEAVQQKASTAAAKAADLFSRAQKAGVTIAFGTDSCVCPHGTQWRQMVYMVEHGMKPLAVLRSATTVAARLLGLADRLGTLEPGRTADLVAVSGDPTQDMTRMKSVVLVVKSGEIVRSERR